MLSLNEISITGVQNGVWKTQEAVNEVRAFFTKKGRNGPRSGILAGGRICDRKRGNWEIELSGSQSL